MIQGSYGTSFAFEAVRELVLHSLYRDNAIQPGIPRAVNVSHSAGPQGPKDFVGT
jgi:hypothetical protein